MQTLIKRPTFRRADSPPRSRRRTPARAFTLVELVVCIATGAIIAGVAGMILFNATHQRSEIAARCQLSDTGGAAMELMLRYLREIQQNECPADPTPCLDGNAQIAAADDDELRFDVYGFRLNGSVLEITRDAGANWHPLSRDVSSLAFTYYESDGSQITSPPLSASEREDIRRIAIDLELARAGQTCRLRCSAYLRNFMNEVENAAP